MAVLTKKIKIMGRSVNYLNNAIKVNYFDWQCDEDGNFEDNFFVVEDIQETIKSEFPLFENSKKWDGRETQIVLEGYGCQIGLSEYCGLATLSIRITDDSDGDEYDTISEWVDKNWDEIGKYWNKFKKIGTFSNGEGVYEKINN